MTYDLNKAFNMLKMNKEINKILEECNQVERGEGKMNFFETIENATKKISKLGNDLNDVVFEIRRTSWKRYATQDDFKDIVILINKDGIQRMSKHDSKDCGLTVEDLKAQDWEVVE